MMQRIGVTDVLKMLVLSVLCATLWGCGDDEPAYYMCNCRPDQYCADDKCYDPDGSVVPAPKAESPEK